LHERIDWGDALRVGLTHYNTLEEVDRFNEVLAELVSSYRGSPSKADDA
jgi:selenocysteine lyase/cysteine desulfurase